MFYLFGDSIIGERFFIDCFSFGFYQFETKFRVKSEVVIEEVESDEESEKMEEDEKQKDCEEDDYGMKEGDDEVGN